MLDRLIDEEETILVPQLWVQETANAVVSALRPGRLSDAQAERCVELLAGLPLELDAHVLDQSALVSASVRHGLSAYDATYLLVAQRTGSRLASLDQRLRDAAHAAGVTLLP